MKMFSQYMRLPKAAGNYFFLLWGSLSLLLFSVGDCKAGEGEKLIESIVLQSQELPFTPDEFYIATVLDERKEKSAMAWLLPVVSGKATAMPQPVDLEGGGMEGLRSFVQKSLPANKKLRPLVLRILECRITEENAGAGVVEGNVVVAFAFDLQKNGELLSLGSYRGGARYKRSVGHYGVVEPALRKSLVSALTYVNSWMEREAPQNIKLAKGVKVKFIDYAVETSDTVFYRPERPLVWDDFKAPPRANNYAAEIFPSFSYKGNSRMEDGFVHLELQLKVFALQHASWVRPGSKDAYGLNHEQRHFDLVKLVAERFKQKVRTLSLGTDDFDGLIGYQYLEFFREMNRLQEAYDGETGHGMNKAAQERWNKKIDEELELFSVN